MIAFSGFGFAVAEFMIAEHVPRVPELSNGAAEACDVYLAR
jgi:hypothetical protein